MKQMGGLLAFDCSRLMILENLSIFRSQSLEWSQLFHPFPSHIGCSLTFVSISLPSLLIIEKRVRKLLPNSNSDREMYERKPQVQNVDAFEQLPAHRVACSFPVYWEWAESKAAQPVEGRCTCVLKPCPIGDNTDYVTQTQVPSHHRLSELKTSNKATRPRATVTRKADPKYFSA
jgi:hypothetical protein